MARLPRPMDLPLGPFVARPSGRPAHRRPRWHALAYPGRLLRWRQGLRRICPGIAETMPAGTARFLLPRRRA